MTDPEVPPTQGFQMSKSRSALELGVLVGGAAALIGASVWLVRHSVDLAIGYVPVEVDRTFGEQVSRALGATSKQCPNPAALAYVQKVAAPLLASLEEKRFSFQLSVSASEEVNAFALPGGFITVNYGLLKAADSGEEVAAVLAHELQHVLQRHGTRRLLRDLGSSALLAALFGGTDIFVPASIAQDLTHTAYDRDQERESDSRGLELLTRADIDPRGMATFFERLAKTSPTLPELVSTHPDPGDRAKKAADAASKHPGARRLPSPKGVPCE
jgi:predicted Zn-dependent protease